MEARKSSVRSAFVGRSASGLSAIRRRTSPSILMMIGQISPRVPSAADASRSTRRRRSSWILRPVSGDFRNVNAADWVEGRDLAPVSVLVERWNAKRLEERLVITAHRQKERKSIDRALLKLS